MVPVVTFVPAEALDDHGPGESHRRVTAYFFCRSRAYELHLREGIPIAPGAWANT